MTWPVSTWIVPGDVRAYLGDPEVTDAAIGTAIDAESAAQAAVCRYPGGGQEYVGDLREALLRRVARNFAMRNLPLGMTQPLADVGIASVRIGSDPEIRRLEAPYRKLVLG